METSACHYFVVPLTLQPSPVVEKNLVLLHRHFLRSSILHIQEMSIENSQKCLILRVY